MNPIEEWDGHDDPPAGANDTRDFAPEHGRLRQMFKHPRRQNRVAGLIFERKRDGEIGNGIHVLVAVGGAWPIDANHFAHQVAIEFVERHFAAYQVEEPPLDALAHVFVVGVGRNRSH